MKPIRVRFKQLTEAPNVLLYQCLQTPDEVRMGGLVIESAGWSIRSSARPMISAAADTIWVGGQEENMDGRICAADYNDPASSIAAKETFAALIRKWNAENADRPTPTTGGIPWVSVDERLPKEDALCLVWPRNGPPVVVMFTLAGRWKYPNSVHGVSFTLTHWAPINPPSIAAPATNDGWEVVE